MIPSSRMVISRHGSRQRGYAARPASPSWRAWMYVRGKVAVCVEVGNAIEVASVETNGKLGLLVIKREKYASDCG
jgi:hypothetical protein